MCYQIKTIKSREGIQSCVPFQVTGCQWGGMTPPKTYGAMGYLSGQGLYVEMTCEEKDPLRTCKEHKMMVCKDSAMEIFLAFAAKGEAISNNCFYVNFEINANGAMYAKKGVGRQGRQFLTHEDYEKSQAQAAIKEDRWTVSLLIPEDFLTEECGWNPKSPEKDMYCNFYKISETKEIEHYGSFHPIASPTPNFHLPACFKKTELAG